MDDTEFISAYLRGLREATAKVDWEGVGKAADALYDAWKQDKVVLFCGNGGSGASCSHIVNDLQKNIAADHQRALKALCLNENMPLVSAYANDVHWESAFALQVTTWGESGGVLVAVSGSGNSRNVLAAIDFAVAGNIKTVGLTGFDGGKLKELADISLHVPTETMQQAEDAHMILLHLLFLLLGRRIAANGL